MPTGTVKFFNAAKGFGFITSDEGRKDVFVPAASISAAGLSTLKTGQRILYDEVADGKGPKAGNLKLLETAAARTDAVPKQGTSSPWTLYCDMSFEESEEILAGLRAAGHEPRVVDYIAAPPNREDLKRLAALLRSVDQSLVRKYDHLFGELRLDDRFISENDFWDAIVEHPSLINGPVVAAGGRACLCHSADALKSFLASQSPEGSRAEMPRKTLSPRLLKLMRGEVSAPAIPVEAVKPVSEPQVRATAPAPKRSEAVAGKPAPAGSKTPKAIKAKTAPKPKAAPVAKAKPSAKKSVKKPAKKAGKR